MAAMGAGDRASSTLHDLALPAACESVCVLSLCRFVERDGEGQQITTQGASVARGGGVRFYAFACWPMTFRDVSSLYMKASLVVKDDWLINHSMRAVEIQTRAFIRDFPVEMIAAPRSHG
jgi:hypothetical protein